MQGGSPWESSQRAGSQGEEVEGVSVHMSSHHFCSSQLPSLQGCTVPLAASWKACAFPLLEKYSSHQPPACPSAACVCGCGREGLTVRNRWAGAGGQQRSKVRAHPPSLPRVAPLSSELSQVSRLGVFSSGTHDRNLSPEEAEPSCTHSGLS